MTSWTGKTIILGIIDEMVSGKVLTGYVSKSPLRDTALYIVVMKIFEVVFVAVTLVSNSRRRPAALVWPDEGKGSWPLRYHL